MDTTHGSGTPLPAHTLHANSRPLVLTGDERRYIRTSLLYLLETDGLDLSRNTPINLRVLDAVRASIALVDAIGPVDNDDQESVELVDLKVIDVLRTIVAEEAEWQLSSDSGTPEGVDVRSAADLAISIALEGKLGVDRSEFMPCGEPAPDPDGQRRAFAARFHELAAEGATAWWASERERKSWARTAATAAREAASGAVRDSGAAG